MIRARGYILVESLVALLVLALVMGSVLATVAQSARRQASALAARRALLLARSELAAVGSAIPATPGTASGLSDDLVWRVSIDPAAPPGKLGTLARVTVAAGPAHEKPRVVLSELRILPPQP